MPLTFRFDAVAVVMLALVLAIAAAIFRFSLRYLDGDPRRPAYLR